MPSNFTGVGAVNAAGNVLDGWRWTDRWVMSFLEIQ